MPDHEAPPSPEWRPASCDPREQLRELARYRTAPAVIRRLVEPPADMAAADIDHIIAHGHAEADAAISRALVEQGLAGRPAPLLLAYAKQHLGWGETEGKNNESAPHPDAALVLAMVHDMLDDYAALKAAGAQKPAELAEGGPPEPAAAQR